MKSGTRRKAARTGWRTRAQDLPGAREEQLTLIPFEPQLAQLGETPPGGDRWIHESKFDGYRLVSSVVDGAPRIWSRNALDWTDKVPTIAKALARLNAASVAVDGELIVGNGRPDDFSALQAALAKGDTTGVRLVLFDLLHVDGVSITDAPLVDRKALLAEILADCPNVLAFSSHVEGHGVEVFEHARHQRLEGIVSKRADAPYRGGRGSGWQKTKNVSSEEFAAVGYTRKKGQRTGFSSLLLARPGEEGWQYAGRVGTGFSQEQLRAISRRIGALGDREPTAIVPDGVIADLRGALWFPPLFVVDAYSRGVGGTGVLRQASLKAVRLDKSPDDLKTRSTEERVTPRPARPRLTVIAADTPSRPRRTVITADGAVVRSGDASPSSPMPIARNQSPRLSGRVSAPKVTAKVSSPDKILFPEDGITKQQVADYYVAVMDHLLPQVIGRPLSVIRCPDGAGGKCFFQKHRTAGMKAVGRAAVKAAAGDDHLVIRDAAGLLELVQHNGIEFHPWGSHADAPDRADRVVFDLDPGPGVAWDDIRSAARQIRGYLKDIGLVSYLRTSGGKGLHVVVPLSPGCDWNVVKDFAKGFAVALAAAEPDRYVAVMTLAKRPDKIFVDYLRNGRGATAVASYSLRARPGAPVAVPITWEELDSVNSGNAFTMQAALRRLQTQERDPWADIDRHHQDLSRWAG